MIQVPAGLDSSEGHDGRICSRPFSLAYRQLPSPCFVLTCLSLCASGVSSSSYKDTSGTSLVAQWLRIRLPMQGTRV